MAVPEIVADRVDTGARLLDRECPGWHINVDPFAVNMSSQTACVLGQLYGEFRLGLNALLSDADSDDIQARYEFGRDHGFDLADEFAGEDLEDLAEAWRTEINTRRWSARPGNLASVGGAA